VEARAQLGTFDVVTLWAVWEHLVNPVEMIRAAASLLRTGGRLVLNSPNGESLHARLQSNWYMATLLEHLHLLTPQACRELARLTGLQVVNLRRCGTPYPLGSRGSGAAGQGLNHESLSFLMGVPLPALGEVQSKQASMKNRLVRTLTQHKVLGSAARSLL